MPAVEREGSVKIHARACEHEQVVALADEIAYAETVELQKAQPVALSISLAQRETLVADRNRKAHDDREAASGRST